MMLTIVYKTDVFNAREHEKRALVSAAESVESYHSWQIKLVAEIPVVIELGVSEKTGRDDKCAYGMLAVLVIGGTGGVVGHKSLVAAVFDNYIALKACAVVASYREEGVAGELSHVFHIEVAAARDVYRVAYGRVEYGRIPEALMRVKAVHIAAVKEKVFAIVARHNTPISVVTDARGAVVLYADK